MKPKNFKRIIDRTPKDIKKYIETSMDILDRIHELLNEKFDGSQVLLAKKLGMSEAYVSQLLNGVKNFSIGTISKLQSAFGENIINVVKKKDSKAVKEWIEFNYKATKK